MRRLALILLAVFAVADDCATPAVAQFGFFYNRPYQRQRSVRPRRRAALPAPAARVPLPVPRPHFASDPPTEVPKQSETTQVPKTEAPKAAEKAPEAPTAPPLPPEKPADLSEKPAVTPAPPPPETEKPEPAAPPAETPKPEETPKTEQPKAGPAGPEAAKPTPPAPTPPEAPTSPPAGTPPLPPPKPAELSKPTAPGVAPSGARLGETPGQPTDDATCVSRLQARKVVVESFSIGPQPDARCTVVQAVHLMSLTLPDGGTVEFPEHPTIACTTADAFSLFVRDLLSPLAKGTFGTPVSRVWTGPGLECRSRDHVFGAKLSAHGQGLAIDIAQLKLGDGTMIEVGQAKDETGQNFETAARNAACGYFHTVLGPGSDSYHRTHWHFDLEVRGSHGDSKYCK